MLLSRRLTLRQRSQEPFDLAQPVIVVDQLGPVLAEFPIRLVMPLDEKCQLALDLSESLAHHPAQTLQFQCCVWLGGLRRGCRHPRSTASTR